MRSVTISIVCLVLAGCVGKAQHDSTLKDLDAAREANASLEEELAAYRGEPAPGDGSGDQLGDREAELEELRRQRAAAEKRLAAFSELNEKLSELIAAGELEVYMRNGLPVIALPSEVLFDSGKAELSKKGGRSLGKVGNALAQMADQRIQVAGHTDNMPIGKNLTWVDNWQLSSERALTVTRFLIEKGVAGERLSAAGHGEFDPVGNNETKSGRRKNRRIELVLLPDLSDLQPVVEAQGEAAEGESE